MRLYVSGAQHLVMTDREIDATLVCKCGCEVPLYRKKARNEGVWVNETTVIKGRCPDCGEQMVRQ